MTRTRFSIAVVSIIALGLSASVALADPAPITKPFCTPQSSPFEVMAGTCHLIKGVSLYGDNMSSLAGISSDMAPSTSVPSTK